MYTIWCGARERTIVKWVPESCRHLEAVIIAVKLRWLALLPLALGHVRHSALAQPRLAHQQSGYNAKYVRVAVEPVKKWMPVVCVRKVSLVPVWRRRIARGGRLEVFRICVHPLVLNKSTHRGDIFGGNCVANHQVSALQQNVCRSKAAKVYHKISAQKSSRAPDNNSNDSAEQQAPSQVKEKFLSVSQERCCLWQVCDAQRLPVLWRSCCPWGSSTNTWRFAACCRVARSGGFLLVLHCSEIRPGGSDGAGMEQR